LTSSSSDFPSGRYVTPFTFDRSWASRIGLLTIDPMPAHAYFLISAVFHYLGPAFAVLLFARLDALGVAWLRIAVAALVFAAWRRPWRLVTRRGTAGRWPLPLAWGAVLAAMNSVFYLALERLPLGTVAAIEFLPVILLAAMAARTRRNLAALALAVAGVYLLTDVQLVAAPLGLVLAAANAVLFAAYIVLSDRAAKDATMSGLDALAMARLPRATYALMVSLLPATATVIGVIVLTQIPTTPEILGVVLVVGGVALHAPHPRSSSPAVPSPPPAPHPSPAPP
jgi:inner membrane transporter RhtA